MTSRVVDVRESSSRTPMKLYVQGFREGLLSGVKPTVVLAVGSSDGGIAGTFELDPESAQTLGEYLRQQAEYAVTTKQDEEK